MSNSSNPPPKPEPVPPDPKWKHIQLHQDVCDALSSMPFHFTTETTIEGISATDIFTLNSALGATIEEQVVATLNRIRSVWDPNDKYGSYGFVRQSQCFPDVLLTTNAGDPPKAPILGIELKGWYILSKEGEPSARFRVTPSACGKADLLVVIPWALKNVLSGPPRVFKPFIISAKHAAQLRNYHWQHVRQTKSDSRIDPPSDPVRPYPNKPDKISDAPKNDSGSNFGRFSRSGIMDSYLKDTLQEPVCGIPAAGWLEFFKIFTDTTKQETAKKRLASLKQKFNSIQLDDIPVQHALIESIFAAIENSLK